MPTLSNDKFSLDGITLPSNFPYHAYESVENWQSMNALGEEVLLKKDDTLSAKENARFCYLVIEGLVASSNNLANDPHRPGAFFLKGSLFLESNALSHLPSDAVFVALQDSRLIRIDNETLKKAMMSDSVVFDLVIKSLARKFFSSTERVREAELYDVRMRIYLMLMGFAKDSGQQMDGSWHRIGFKLTQQMAAELLGVSRITVNTAMKNLEEENMVKRLKGHYWVNDAKGLLTEG